MCPFFEIKEILDDVKWSEFCKGEGYDESIEGAGYLDINLTVKEARGYGIIKWIMYAEIVVVLKMSKTW